MLSNAYYRIRACIARRREPSGQDLADKRFKDPKVLELRRKWYKKLAKSGFKDAEITDWYTGESRERMNGISQADVVNTWTPEQERYYQLAVHWVRVMEARMRKRISDALGLPKVTRNKVEIWRLHAEGKPYSFIAKKRGLSKSAVGTIVNKEKEFMLEFDWEMHGDLLEPY